MLISRTALFNTIIIGILNISLVITLVRELETTALCMDCRRGRNNSRIHSSSNRDFFNGSGGTWREITSKSNEENESSKLSSRMAGLQLLTRLKEDIKDRGVHSPRGQRRGIGEQTPSTTYAQTNKERRGPIIATRNTVPANTMLNTTDKARKESDNARGKDMVMVDGVKFIGENMDMNDFICEYLNENSNFTVIAAIGPQGAGKSTLLSMIGGNDSQDMYRQYIFRPASREAVESSRHQTTKVHAYITKSRQILLDCQATNCAAILDEALRYSRSSKLDDRQDVANHVECIQLIAFLLHICNTLLLCTDLVMDIELVKIVRIAEMMRANLEYVAGNGIPSLNSNRKVNLVMLHTRAKSVDFALPVQKERAALLRALFSDSRRIRVMENDEYAFVPLADIKPRKDTIANPHGQSMTTVEKLLDTQEVVEFEKGIRRLRLILAALPKDTFAANEQTINEKQWLLMARAVWSDVAFQSGIDQFAAFL